MATTDNVLVAQADVLGGIVIHPSLTAPYAVTAGHTYYVTFQYDNDNTCFYFDSAPGAIEPGEQTTLYTGTQDLPGSFTAYYYTISLSAGLTVCPTANIHGDPVFLGFHGQTFLVKGEADRVFDILSSTDFSLNSRFVSLSSSNQSITAAQMNAVRRQYRLKQSKLLSLAGGIAGMGSAADSVSSALSIPPSTAAWNHAGTYLGECGVRLGGSKLYVQPGAYATGFTQVTLDNVTVPVSSTAILLDGNMTVTRISAYKLTISTLTVRFTIVNSDHFVNIERASVLDENAQLAGLLGQTADKEWEVRQSKAWKRQLESEYKLNSNQLFGADYEGQQY